VVNLNRKRCSVCGRVLLLIIIFTYDIWARYVALVSDLGLRHQYDVFYVHKGPVPLFTFNSDLAPTIFYATDMFFALTLHAHVC